MFWKMLRWHAGQKRMDCGCEWLMVMVWFSAGCMMGWPSVCNGYAKNILAGYGNSVPVLLLATAFHWVMFLVPWLWLLAGAFVDLPGWPLTPALLILAGLLIRAVTAVFSRQRLVDALWMPVSVLLMTAIAWQAIQWHRTGGPRWKGRTVPHQRAPSPQPAHTDLSTAEQQRHHAMTDPILVIGAGIGGLSSAIRLAAAGRRVVVLEKNERVGGKMYQLEADGYRWDTGPSVITMRHVFEDLFAAAGRRLDDYITLQAVDPLTRYFFSDGSRLDATDDIDTMAQQIDALAPGDGAGYRRYLDYAARIHRVTGPVFIYDQPPTPASFAKVPVWDWLKADPFRTMAGAINAHVSSPQMRQLLGRFATYVGGSPYAAPATLNVIADVELSGGVWYPRGGVYNIAAGMARLAEELGVEICTNTPVSRIEVTDGQATGVILGDGSHITASAVVANADVTAVYRHLLPTDDPAIARRLQKLTDYPPSCSGFVMLLGVDHSFDELAHHNIFFNEDYPAEFDAIFKRGVPPEDPTIYVNISSKTDPDHALQGGENWFVLINAPPLGDGSTGRRDASLPRLVYNDSRIAASMPVRTFAANISSHQRTWNACPARGVVRSTDLRLTANGPPSAARTTAARMCAASTSQAGPRIPAEVCRWSPYRVVAADMLLADTP
ncbi:phytoene desaturase [bacterium]|nr:phytoene desaturase [bacterium]